MSLKSKLMALFAKKLRESVSPGATRCAVEINACAPGPIWPVTAYCLLMPAGSTLLLPLGLGPPVVRNQLPMPPAWFNTVHDLRHMPASHSLRPSSGC